MDEQKANILIVDDNPEIQEIIRILLEGEGFETAAAADGTAAQQLLQKQDFDLIILDIMLPGINGYQTCLNLRKISNTPVLFLSALGKDSDKILGFSSGGDDYLTKPFSYSELVSRVKALIRRYQVYRGKKNSRSFARTCSFITWKSTKPKKKYIPKESGWNSLIRSMRSCCFSSKTVISFFPPPACMKLSGRNPIITAQTIRLWCTSGIFAKRLRKIQPIQY